MSIKEKKSKFYYQFMLYGVRKHGLCKGCDSYSKAVEFEAEIKEQVSLIYRGKKDVSEVTTLREMFAMLLDYSKTNNSQSQYGSSKRNSEKMEVYFGSETIIKDITPIKIEQFKSYLLQEGLKKSTINRYIATLSKAFNLIIINKRLNIQNPCMLVSKFKEDNHILRYLTEDEEARLMNALADHLKPIVICALTTGLRLSNILNLKWENINLDVGFIEILKQENKGHKKIQIPVGKKLHTVLKQIGIKKSGYVFINPDTNQPYTTIKTGFNKALQRAGIDNFRFHDLRHTVGTRLVANGADLQTVKEILAHSDIRTTQRYMHPVKDNLKKAVEILDKF